MAYARSHDDSIPFLDSAAEKIATLQTNYDPTRYYREASRLVSKHRTRMPSMHKEDDAIRLEKIRILQRINDIVGTVLKIGSTGLAAAMGSILTYVLYKFYMTQDLAAPQAHRTSPWAKGTQLWPAFLLGLSSFLTLIVEVGSLIAGCCALNVQKADKVGSSFTTAGRVIWVAKWAAVAVLYRLGRTTKDLWGWSCDKRADDIQQFYPELNFHELCTVQSVAWYMSICEFAIKLILMIVVLCLVVKARRLDLLRK